MEMITVSAKTVDEAVTKALINWRPPVISWFMKWLIKVAQDF